MRLSRFYPHLICLLLLTAYVALVMLGVKTFRLGSQEVDLIGSNPIMLFEAFHFHALRYLIVWPVITLAQWVGGNIDLFFSFHVLLVAYGLSWLLEKILLLLLPATQQQNPAWYRVIFLAGWLVILLAMHGRLINQFFGMAAILYAHLIFLQQGKSGKSCLWRIMFWQLVGLVFSSVSTGTFSVAFGAIALFMLSPIVTTSRPRQPAAKRYVLASGLLLLLFLPLESQYFVKNACYFSHDLLSNTSACQLLKVTNEEMQTADMTMLDFPIDPKYHLDGAFGKAFRHGPFYPLITAGVHPYIAFGLFWLTFVGGFVIGFGSYFFRTTRWAKWDKFRPLCAPIGPALSVGTMGVKSMLMAWPSLMVIVAYVYLNRAKR